MKLILTHHTASQISVSCDGQVSHVFDMDTILTLTHSNDPPELTDPQTYGRAVYQALFPPGALSRIMLDGEPEQLLLVLTADDLDAVGWEYAYGPYTGDQDDFLVLACHVVRGLPADQRIIAPTLDESLHIVAIPSNPLNIEGEWLRLRDIIGSLTSACRLERTRPPTLEQVRRLVANQHHRIIHFMGHGGQSEQGAVLYFEQENGELAAATARECIQRLHGTIFLITLNACASAAPATTPFGNLAAAFMRQKTPYALGMRLSIPDEDARAFSRTFYSELASGSPVEEALRQARLMLAKSERPWVIGVPVLYTALSTSAPGFPYVPGTPTVEEHQPRIEVSALPRAEGGFQGRYDELKQLGSWLTGDVRKRIVTIHGGGGQGKTALAREAVERFAYAWPNGVWATSLEQLPSCADFLTDLARFLGILTQEILDTKEVERRVLAALPRRRVLIVLDNAETLVEAVIAKDAAAIDLAQLLQQIPGPSVSLLITSRVPLGWGGEELFELGGLAPKEGADLFIQGAPRRRSEIKDMQAWDISERLVGHPFGLRLLSSAFDHSTLSPDGLLQEYETFLLQTEDIYQQPDNRRRTLTACLEVSVRHLGAEPRALLSGLWIFHAPFLPETAVSIFDPACQEGEQSRSPVRKHLQALWERGLLMRQSVPTREGSLLFYHLLPTTRPYVEQRMQQVYEREELLKRFGAAYAERAQRIHSRLDSSAVAVVFAQQAREDFERGIQYTSGAEQGNYLLDWGWIVYQLGNVQGGLRHLENAQEVAEGLDRQLELRTINTLALLQDHIGLRREALTQYQRILPVRRELQDRPGEASTLNNIGLVFSNLGQPGEALHHYERALLIMRELGDRKVEATILSNIALVYSNTGQPYKALELYEQALPIQRAAGDRFGEATTLNNMATVYGDIGQLEEALHCSEQALSIRREVGDRAGEATTLNNIGATYRALGKLEDALAFYRQASPIMLEVDNPVGEAATLNNIALIFRTTRHNQDALHTYEQALAIMRKIEDRTSEAATLSNIGAVYGALGKREDALAHYEEALGITRDIGDRASEATILNNMAAIYREQGRQQEALSCFEQALHIRQEIGDRIGEGATLSNLAIVYRETNRIPEALAFCQQALDISREIKDRAGEAIALNNMALIHKQIGHSQEALTIYQQALAMMRETHQREGEAAALNNMADILHDAGLLQEALALYEQALAIMDELEAEERE